MRRLVYGSAAVRDLEAILDYVTRQSGSLDLGLRFTDELRRKCAHLAELPGALGRSRPELPPDIRSFAFKGYVIFFRYLGEDLFEVVNVLERHRDVDALFTES